MTASLLPLEKLLARYQSECPNRFPRPTTKYFDQYQQAVNVLRTKYYPLVDTGLANNSKDSGFYTLHNAEHFDDVVRHASILLSCEDDVRLENLKEPCQRLHPYELYVLLLAIRIHDVGNMYGRENHEKQCFRILKDLGDATGTDVYEKNIIAKIAQAHGGRAADGTKDTIAGLPPVFDLHTEQIRPRLLAAITRIADEVCENKSRAATALLEANQLPHHSQIYHKYAASLNSNRWEPTNRTMRLSFHVSLSDLTKPWGCEKREIHSGEQEPHAYLFGEILHRLIKMNSERRYCNLFSKDIITIDGIIATIEIYDDQHDALLKSVPIEGLTDTGYPDDNVGEKIKASVKDFLDPAYWRNFSGA